MTKKMKPVKAWAGVLPNGEIEREGAVLASGNGDGMPYLYPTKKRAKAHLPGGWRIARVEIREVKKP